MPSLDGLLCFHHVAAQQSLVRAAKVLAVSPPAVTHALSRLEDALQVKLCVRGRRGFRLTEAGKALFERTKVIVGELDGYANFLRDPQEFTGILSLGIGDGCANAAFQEALNRTVSRFPKMRLSLTVASSDELMRDVLSGELDAACAVFFKKSERLSYLEIGRSTTHYFVSKRHPLASRKRWKREDLFGQSLLWVDGRSRSRQELASDVFVDHPRYKMMVRASTNRLEGALAVLRSGFAIAPMDPRDIARLADAREFVEVIVDTKKPAYREECAFNAEAVQSEAVKFFLEEIRKVATARAMNR